MTTATGDTDLQLLLTHAEEHLPVLDRGLPGAPLRELSPDAPPPDVAPVPVAGRDPDDLAARRWGVVAPAGDDGDRLLDAIRPLIDHRRAQQDTAPRIDRVDALDAAAAARWRDEFLRDARRPRFVLLLGDLDRVTLALQRALAGCAHVGRLHCPTVKGYRDYAEKLVARERAAPAPRARSLFYTVQDGTAAIEAAYASLVEPTMAATRAWLAAHELASLAEVPFSDWGPDELLALAGVDEPTVLVAAGHGIGAPKKGWRSPEQQRALQGALSMGLESPLAADTVQRAAFLPGGVWICGASFAAASPGDSAFAPWLRRLAERGDARQPAQDVLRGLAGDARPFVAALPQALLANPRGPLAVIGPADLAWADPRDDDDRLSAVLRGLLAGRRVGVALDAARAPRRPEPDATPARRWLRRHDLRDYLLLGDPAARLAVHGLAPELSDSSGPTELATEPPPEAPAAQPVPPEAPAARPPVPADTPPPAIITPAAPPAPPAEPTAVISAARAIAVEPAPAIIAPTPIIPAEHTPAALASAHRSIPVEPAPTTTTTTPMIPPEPAALASAPRSIPVEPAPTIITPTRPEHTPAALASAHQPSPLDPPPASIITPTRPEHPPAALPSAPPPIPVDPASITAPAPPIPTRHARAPAPPTDPQPRPLAPFHSPATFAPPPEAPMSTSSTHPLAAPDSSQAAGSAHAYAPPLGAAPLAAVTRPRTLENPEIALRERAVLAMLRGDEAPRSIAVRFGLPLEEIFYWLDVYREAGRRSLAG